MKRVHLILSGKVHEVTFRDFIRKEAEKGDITGFVRNLQDGTVEVVGEGDEDKLKIFVRECKRGPLLAFVKEAKETYSEPTGEYDGFSIRF